MSDTPKNELRVEAGETPIVVRGGLGCSILALLLLAIFAVLVQSCTACRPLWTVGERAK